MVICRWAVTMELADWDRTVRHCYYKKNAIQISVKQDDTCLDSILYRWISVVRYPALEMIDYSAGAAGKSTATSVRL